MRFYVIKYGDPKEKERIYVIKYGDPKEKERTFTLDCKINVIKYPPTSSE